MALIKPGIHESLVLTDKTKINEHGSLELCIASVQDDAALMAAFTGNTTFQAMESSFRFYPPNLTDFDKVKKKAGEIGADLLKVRHQFKQYALMYGTEAEVDAAIGGVKMFEGLGIAPEEMGKAINMLVQEAFLQKVMTNLSTKFLNFLKEKNAFSGKVIFRHKFLRQSTDKNYAVIPTSDFDVWVEPISVPKAASKIAFSKWEIDNGKDNPHPTGSDTAQSTQADVNKAKDLFAKPEAAAAAPKPNLFGAPVETVAEAVAEQAAPEPAEVAEAPDAPVTEA